MSKAKDTRMMILQKAFELIYRQGYQATSIDEIIATTNLTKGALFYHFKNKEEMGLAIINEVMYPGLITYMKPQINRTGNIREDLYNMMSNLLLQAPFFKVEYGCPAVNLIDEMAPLNKSFRMALTRIVREWQSAIKSAVVRAQAEGRLDPAKDANAIAIYITSNYSGVRNMGKLFGRKAYTSFLKVFKDYLDGLG
jgi:TetR/AcrR family transcriptional regulator, transcriptional repressor for nem operon